MRSRRGISPETAHGWPAYAAGVAWSLLERGYDGPGLNLAFTSCVPLGVGLSSSAALSCSAARAVNGLWRLALDTPEARVDLAEAARDAENIIGAPIDVDIGNAGMNGAVPGIQHLCLECRTTIFLARLTEQKQIAGLLPTEDSDDDV